MARASVLIIDDDFEIRKCLKDELSPYYTVVEATNGKDGLEKASHEHPSFIICDIMMPDIDGVSVCRSIKNSQLTQHNPIILLTAKASIEEQIDGLKRSKAEQYISKPFHIEYLKVCINNLLPCSADSNMNNDDVKVLEKDNSIKSSDERFISNYNRMIEDHYSDAKFNVNAMCESLFISRVHLHRKIRTIYNTTPSEMISEYRLKEAERLLLTTSLSISEVAFRVGFNSSTNFSKTFKKKFGLSPTSYSAIKKSDSVLKKD